MREVRRLVVTSRTDLMITSLGSTPAANARASIKVDSCALKSVAVIGSDISMLMSAGVPGGGSRKGVGAVVKENATVSFGLVQISPGAPMKAPLHTHEVAAKLAVPYVSAFWGHLLHAVSLAPAVR